MFWYACVYTIKIFGVHDSICRDTIKVMFASCSHTHTDVSVAMAMLWLHKHDIKAMAWSLVKYFLFCTCTINHD